jgi:hypothetical protein
MEIAGVDFQKTPCHLNQLQRVSFRSEAPHPKLATTETFDSNWLMKEEEIARAGRHRAAF